MLDLYKDSQKQFYDAICSSVSKDRISHAYFIETSGFANGEELVLSFAKFLLCKNHFTNLEHCGDCSFCHLIDQKADGHIYLIEPDGIWIKKEQLENMKNQFSMKSTDGLPMIYIIFQADKLNKSAANSILKFIEEPEDGIIAILVAENRYQVLPTILSRCQVYTLVNNSSVVTIKEPDERLYDFLVNIERNGEKTICYLKSLWHDFYKTKEEVVTAFDQIERLFLEVLNVKVESMESNSFFKDAINFICNHNTVSELIRKLKVIRDTKEALVYNANLSLLMDKFVIDYVGGEERC